jgi:hypothetical protein
VLSGGRPVGSFGKRHASNKAWLLAQPVFAGQGGFPRLRYWAGRVHTAMLTAASFYLKRVQLSGMTVADDHRLIMARSGIVSYV